MMRSTILRQIGSLTLLLLYSSQAFAVKVGDVISLRGQTGTVTQIEDNGEVLIDFGSGRVLKTHQSILADQLSNPPCDRSTQVEQDKKDLSKTLQEVSSALLSYDVRKRLLAPYRELEATKQSGALIERRRISEDVDVMIHENESYLIWTQGPKRSHIYRILSKKKGATFTPPSAGHIRDHFLSELERVQNLSPEEVEKASDNLSRYLSDTFENVYGTYPFREAQYFHFSIETDEVIRFYLTMQEMRPDNFFLQGGIIKRLIPEIDKKLESLKENKEALKIYTELKECLLSLGEKKPKKEDIYRLRNDDDDTLLGNCRPETDRLPESLHTDFNTLFARLKTIDAHLLRARVPVHITQGPSSFLGTSTEVPKLYLTHGTFSQKLPNIIQLGGLSSYNNAALNHIIKTTGGETGGGRSHGAADPDLVSFWENKEGRAKVGFGFGLRNGFEYPITFGIGKDHYSSPDCTNANSANKEALRKKGGSIARWGDLSHLDGTRFGAMNQEAIVVGFYPLKCIDYVIVPPFAIEEVQSTLRDHRLDHIKVIPYSKEIMNQ